VLIYFIHHVSQNIQAENLIAEVGHDFEHLLPTLYPEHIGHEEPDANLDEADLPTAKEWDDTRQSTNEAGYRRIEARLQATLLRLNEWQMSHD
jgi:uncharacterized membrane protein